MGGGASGQQWVRATLQPGIQAAAISERQNPNDLTVQVVESSKVVHYGEQAAYNAVLFSITAHRRVRSLSQPVLPMLSWSAKYSPPSAPEPCNREEQVGWPAPSGRPIS